MEECAINEDNRVYVERIGIGIGGGGEWIYNDAPGDDLLYKHIPCVRG